MRILLHDYGGYPFTHQLGRMLAARAPGVGYYFSETTQFVQRGSASAEKDNGFHAEGLRLSTPFEKYAYLKRRAAEIEHGSLVAEKIRQGRPRVVVSANTPLDAQAVIQQASREVGARFVFWFQDAIGLATRRALHQKLPIAGDVVGAYYEHLERALVRKSDHIILIAEDFIPLMERWGVAREKMSVLPNWAPVEAITPQPKFNEWSAAQGLADKFCFLYTGILGLKHNPYLFIRLAEYFRGETGVRVVVVSEGGGADWLREEKQRRGLENLTLLPFQPAEVYPQVLGSADVLVSILSADAGAYSVPSKVLTYLCAGRPVLLAVPPENQAARIILGAGAGLIAPPKSVGAFLENAGALYQDPSRRTEYGEAARRYAVRNFDIQRITAQFEAILENL